MRRNTGNPVPKFFIFYKQTLQGFCQIDLLGSLFARFVGLLPPESSPDVDEGARDRVEAGHGGNGPVCISGNRFVDVKDVQEAEEDPEHVPRESRRATTRGWTPRKSTEGEEMKDLEVIGAHFDFAFYCF